MAFSQKKEQLYLKTEALGVGPGASLLQAEDIMWFPKLKHQKNKFYDQKHVQASNIERESLGLLHGLKNSITTASPMKSV